MAPMVWCGCRWSGAVLSGGRAHAAVSAATPARGGPKVERAAWQPQRRPSRAAASIATTEATTPTATVTRRRSRLRRDAEGA